MMISDNMGGDIIFSPHLDDAVFSIGGFISKKAPRVSVVTFFAGKPLPRIQSWWDRLCGFKDSDQAITARLNEDKNAFAVLGLPTEQLQYCSFLDIQYRHTLGTNTKETQNNLQEKLVLEIEKILTERKPLNVYFPLMRLHPDHALLSKAVLEVFRRKKDIPTSFYFYEDLPYAYFFYFKNKITRIVSATKHTLRAELALYDENITLEENNIPLTVGEFERKIVAIKKYRSQFVHLRSLLLWIVKKSAKAKGVTKSKPYVEVLYKLHRSL